MELIKSTFSKLFVGSQNRSRPIAGEYINFTKRWGWSKTLFEVSNESLLEVKKIEQMYLTTVMFYLTYLKDKSGAEEAQRRLDEQMRKLKR